MSLLAPLFLLGALAIAGPVLFHLVRRTSRQRTLFSSIMFLPASRPRLTHRSRLEHLLLLLLRCLAIALLALGFARPFLRRAAPLPGAASASRRVVVLVDVSASMRRTGLWAQARSRAAAALRGLAPGDEAALFAFSRRLTPLIGFEQWRATPPAARAALAEAKLAALRPGWEEDRLGDALIGAAEALGDAGAGQPEEGPREIVLVSDVTAGSHPEALQAYDWPKGVQLRVEALAAARPTNAGLQLVAEAPDADQLAAPAVRVRVSNAANSAREQFQVGWMRPSAAGFAAPPLDVYVPPGQSRVLAVPAAPAGERELALRGDDEDFDNRLFVVPAVRQRWNALYLGADSADDPRGALFFLQRALPDTPRLTVKVQAHAPSAAISPAELQAAPLAFVTDAVPAGAADALHQALLAGKTVVFAPRGAEAAGTLARLAGVPAAPLEDRQPSDYAMLGEIDFRHPLFAPFADPHFSDFTKIHIWRYRRLDPTSLPGLRVAARFDSGDPAVAELSVGRGRLVLLLAGWDPADSQLAVSSKFVPLIGSILDLAGGPSGEAAQAFAGDPLPLAAAAKSAEPTEVRRPDGAVASLPAGTASYAGADEPGIYEFRNGSRAWQVGVNVAPSASRTEPLAADELERYGAPGPPDAAAPARDAQRAALVQAADAESRQKLWRWLLAGTLVVLLAESFLAGWTSRPA